MNILIYGLNFSPELVGIGKYTGELAEELVRRGHRVVVVTAPPYYPAWQVGQGYSSRHYRVEERSGCRVIRCPLYVPRKVTGLKRVAHLLSFTLSSAPVLRAEARSHPDLILAIAPSLLAVPAAARAGRKNHIPTWLHIQDFEIDAALNLGILGSGRGSFLQRLLLRFEGNTFNGFARLSSISSRMVERLRQKGVPSSRALLFPNWIDTREIYPLPDPFEFRSRLGLSTSDIIVLYSGSMGKKQGLEVLLDAARHLRAQSSIHFVICGEGPARAALEEIASSLNNIHFLPLQPADQLNQLLNMADIHVLPQRKDAADLVMPSKLLGMMASGRPVIAGCLPGSELYNVVEKIGIPVQPEDSQALAEAILSLSQDHERRQSLGLQGRQYVLDHFSKQVVIDQFLNEVEKLLQL